MSPHILWKQSCPPPIILAPAGGLRKCTARSYRTSCTWEGGTSPLCITWHSSSFTWGGGSSPPPHNLAQFQVYLRGRDQSPPTQIRTIPGLPERAGPVPPHNLAQFQVYLRGGTSPLHITWHNSRFTWEGRTIPLHITWHSSRFTWEGGTSPLRTNWDNSRFTWEGVGTGPGLPKRAGPVPSAQLTQFQVYLRGRDQSPPHSLAQSSVTGFQSGLAVSFQQKVQLTFLTKSFLEVRCVLWHYFRNLP